MSSIYLHLNSILPQNPQHQFHQKYIPPNPNVRPPPPIKATNQHQLNQIKSNKPFSQKVSGPSGPMREGDWICNLCNNLNFSFRTECNRCQLKTRETNHHSQNNMKTWVVPDTFIPHIRPDDQLYNQYHSRDVLKELSENCDGHLNAGSMLSTAPTSKRGSHSSESQSFISEDTNDEPGFHYMILVVPQSFKEKCLDFENIAQASKLIDNKYLGEEELAEEVSQRGTKSFIDFNNLPNIKFLF